MANNYFDFKQFRIEQDRCAMKVTTDASVFGGWAVERLSTPLSEDIRILDIGTGTGLLSLMIAQSIPNAQIHAVEIDSVAVEQAKNNIQKTAWTNRIQVELTNLLDLDRIHQYDRIISNPPFYEKELTSPNKKKNQAYHDESLPFSKLIGRLERHLKNDGRFYLLLPAKSIDQRLEKIKSAGLHIYRQASFRHSNKHPVSRYFLEGGKTRSDQSEVEEIFLQQPDGRYSERVRELLHAYYLSF